MQAPAHAAVSDDSNSSEYWSTHAGRIIQDAPAFGQRAAQSCITPRDRQLFADEHSDIICVGCHEQTGAVGEGALSIATARRDASAICKNSTVLPDKIAIMHNKPNLIRTRLLPAQPRKCSNGSLGMCVATARENVPLQTNAIYLPQGQGYCTVASAQWRAAGFMDCFLSTRVHGLKLIGRSDADASVKNTCNRSSVMPAERVDESAVALRYARIHHPSHTCVSSQIRSARLNANEAYQVPRSVWQSPLTQA